MNGSRRAGEESSHIKTITIGPIPGQELPTTGQASSEEVPGSMMKRERPAISICLLLISLT